MYIHDLFFVLLRWEKKYIFFSTNHIFVALGELGAISNKTASSPLGLQLKLK